MCPIAIPSQTAIAGKTTGTPPASATPSFTASTILSKFICPGTISLYELTIPTIGFLISSAVKPSALKRLLAGACFIPALALSLFIKYSFLIRFSNYLLYIYFFLSLTNVSPNNTI